MRLLLSLVLLLQSETLDAPLPDFKNPVDYAGWIDANFGVKGENAADRYRELEKLYKPSREASQVASFKTGAKWTEQERKVVREWVTQNEQALKVFAEAAALRECHFPFARAKQADLPAATPALGGLRALTSCATARARLRLLEGDWRAALDDVVTVLRAARHAQSQPAVRQVMTGRALASMAYAVLREVPQLAGDQVDYPELLKRLRREDHGAPSLKRAIDTQRAFFLASLQKDGKDADGDGRLEAFEMPGNTILKLEPPQTPSELLSHCTQLLDLMHKMQTARYREAQSLAQQGMAMIAGFRPAEVGNLMPNLFPTDKERRAHDARASATRLVLCLFAYQRQHKAWPASLRDATVDEASSVRKDPFSDDEFVYRIADGQPLLYSIGADGVDNGGKYDPYDHYGDSSDLVFWPPAP